MIARPAWIAGKFSANVLVTYGSRDCTGVHANFALRINPLSDSIHLPENQIQTSNFKPLAD